MANPQKKPEVNDHDMDWNSFAAGSDKKLQPKTNSKQTQSGDHKLTTQFLDDLSHVLRTKRTDYLDPLAAIANARHNPTIQRQLLLEELNRQLETGQISFANADLTFKNLLAKQVSVGQLTKQNATQEYNKWLSIQVVRGSAAPHDAQSSLQNFDNNIQQVKVNAKEHQHTAKPSFGNLRNKRELDAQNQPKPTPRQTPRPGML